MASVEDDNNQIDLDEIDLKSLEKNSDLNLQNNSEEMYNIESESKDENLYLKDNIEKKNDNENKEILFNEVIDEKYKENKEENIKDEVEEDNKRENNEVKNKSDIKKSINQSFDYNDNKNNIEIKNEDDDQAEKNYKYKISNMIKDNLSPSNSNASYRPSEYRSILKNTILTESDKLLIEKYTNYNINHYKINNNDLYYNLGFTKRLPHNYQTLDEPKTVNYLSKYKYNSIEGIPKQSFKNNYIHNSISLLENENEKPKHYVIGNKLIINDIEKDTNFSLNKLDNKDDKKIEKNNLEKIIFTNSQIEKDKNNSNKSDKNDDIQDFNKSLKGDYSNKRNLNKEDEDFNLNINYSYNIPRNSDMNQNLLCKTSLSNYHIPHTQSSIIKKYTSNYSIFDFHRYNNYKSNSSLISNINKYSNNIQNIDNQNIDNQNINNDSQYNNFKSILNYENKNINNKYTNFMVNKNDKSLDNTNNIINKENQNNINQSIKWNEKSFINKINNSKCIPSKTLFIPNNNTKRFKSLLFDTEKKSSFISEHKNNSYADKSDIQNNLGQNYYKKRTELLQPYQYYPFQTIIQDNLNQNQIQNDDLIIKHRKGGAFRDNIKEVIINISPSDFYYNTLHQEYIPKIKNIGRKIKPQFSNDNKENQDSYKALNNNKCLFNFSTIRRDLINKNKSKKFKAL